MQARIDGENRAPIADTLNRVVDDLPGGRTAAARQGRFDRLPPALAVVGRTRRAGAGL